MELFTEREHNTLRQTPEGFLKGKVGSKCLSGDKTGMMGRGSQEMGSEKREDVEECSLSSVTWEGADMLHLALFPSHSAIPGDPKRPQKRDNMGVQC